MGKYKMIESGTINQFICEDVEALETIPKNEYNFGSIAIIQDTAQIYMADSTREWKPFGAVTTEAGE